jgi:hypothetical protein
MSGARHQLDLFDVGRPTAPRSRHAIPLPCKGCGAPVLVTLDGREHRVPCSACGAVTTIRATVRGAR